MCPVAPALVPMSGAGAGAGWSPGASLLGSHGDGAPGSPGKIRRGFYSFRQLLKCFHLISHDTYASVKQLAYELIRRDA